MENSVSTLIPTEKIEDLELTAEGKFTDKQKQGLSVSPRSMGIFLPFYDPHNPEFGLSHWVGISELDASMLADLFETKATQLESGIQNDRVKPIALEYASQLREARRHLLEPQKNTNEANWLDLHYRLTRAHEYTHLDQEIRFKRQFLYDAIGEDLMKLQKSKPEVFFQYYYSLADTMSRLMGFMEAQAFITSYLQIKSEDHDILRHYLLYHFAHALLIFIKAHILAPSDPRTQTGTTNLDIIIEDLQNKRLVSYFGKKNEENDVIPTSHLLARIIIITQRPHVLDEIAEGKITEEELTELILEGIGTFLVDPIAFVERSSSVEFRLHIDQVCMATFSELQEKHAHLYAVLYPPETDYEES